MRKRAISCLDFIKNKLEIFFENTENLLVRCVTGNGLFTKPQTDIIPGRKSSEIFINSRGEVFPLHTLDLDFDLNNFVMVLREKLQWKQIFWKLWANTIMFYGSECEKYFRAVDYDKGSYHPESTIYPYDSLIGRFGGCPQQVHKFNSQGVFPSSEGGEFKEHVIDLSHYSVKQKDSDRFKRNSPVIFDYKDEKSYTKDVIETSLNELSYNIVEKLSDEIDIESLFSTSKTSKYLEIKSLKVGAPQIQIKKDSITPSNNKNKNSKINFEEEVKKKAIKKKEKEEVWRKDALVDDDAKAMEMLALNLKKLRK